jgi:DNA-binding NarL/FixJ family response regulator
MPSIRILLADDHQLFIDGIASLLSRIEDVTVVATANNGNEVLKVLANQTCDLVIMDVHMPGMDGIETTRVIRQLHPSVKVLTLTMDNELGITKQILKAGASGYILKNTGRDEFEKAIRKIVAGENYFSEAVMLELAQQYMPQPIKQKDAKGSAPQLLSRRESEILSLIAREYSNQEIGEKLFISSKTVETHRKNLMRKLGVKNALGLVKAAIRSGLLEIK